MSYSEQVESRAIFDTICKTISEQGYGVFPKAIPENIANALCKQVREIPAEQFRKASIGRHQVREVNHFVRTDEICWINRDCEAGRMWLDWAAELQTFLNRRLFLGLFSFESHFAHYAPGDFYRMHLDAFRGEASRVLSLVVYLNPDWQPLDGGELIIQLNNSAREVVKVAPVFGTVVVFLSEEFPHEVLPAKHDRYSVAGWFRLNTSTNNRVDPPAWV